MKRNCPDCGEVPDSAHFCPDCGRRVRSNWLLSFFEWFRWRSGNRGPVVRTVIRREQVSGKELSADQVKRDARAGRLNLNQGTRFRFEGPDGVVREFDSLDQMPPELRAKFEEAHRDLLRGR